MSQEKDNKMEKTMFDGKELEPPPMAVAVANITKSNHNIMGLSSNAAEPWPTRLGMVGSFLGLDLLGVGHLIGDSGDEVVFKPEVGDLALVMLVEQFQEVLLDSYELGLRGGGRLGLAGLGNSLGLGAHAKLIAKAADGLVVQLAVVLDRLFIEDWVIGISGFDLDDGLLALDLGLVLRLGVLAWGWLAVGLRRGGLRRELFLVEDLGLLPDDVVDVVHTSPSGGQGLLSDALLLFVFLGEEGDILDQDLLGGRVFTIVFLLDYLKESKQVVLDLAQLRVGQLPLEERWWHDFDYSHRETRFFQLMIKRYAQPIIKIKS